MAPPWNALAIRLRLNVAEPQIIRCEAEPRNKERDSLPFEIEARWPRYVAVDFSHGSGDSR